jgi:hypothetical protein
MNIGHLGGSFSRVDIWLGSEWKELDAHQKQNVFGVPYPVLPGAMVLGYHWNNVQPLGTPRKARPNAFLVHRLAVHTFVPCFVAYPTDLRLDWQSPRRHASLSLWKGS